MYWPDALEALAFVGFGADLAVRGHASDVAGICVVLAIRLARQVWPKPQPVRDATGVEMQNLRDQLDQLKADVSRVSLVVGITNKG